MRCRPRRSAACGPGWPCSRLLRGGGALLAVGIFSRWNDSDFGNPPFHAKKGSPYEVYIPLNISAAEWEERVLSLRDRGFLDKHARILNVYFNAFNVNTQLLMCARLQIRFNHFGGMTRRASVRTLSLNRHLGPVFNSDRWNQGYHVSHGLKLAVEALFVIFLGIVLVAQIREAMTVSHANFESPHPIRC